MTGFVAPMLATLTEDHFSDPGWIYERKFDGVRCIVVRDGDRASLYSRNRNRLDDGYPELIDALAAEPCRDFVADGEIVAFDGKVTSFSRLQGRMQIRSPDEARRSGIPVYLYLFDLLRLDGEDLGGTPLRERKALLKKSFHFKGPVRYTQHRNEKGEAYWREACAKGWEGVIAKRADSRYVHGRSRDWLKFKCVNRQELVIGGYTEPQGGRTGFGALLVGYYRDGKLRYAGRVGTGFDEAMLDSLHREMARRSRKTAPFADYDGATQGVHWVAPELVGEVGFTEWTGSGKLRHPRFLGLRDDKKATDVVREGSA